MRAYATSTSKMRSLRVLHVIARTFAWNEIEVDCKALVRLTTEPAFDRGYTFPTRSDAPTLYYPSTLLLSRPAPFEAHKKTRQNKT